MLISWWNGDALKASPVKPAAQYNTSASFLRRASVNAQGGLHGETFNPLPGQPQQTKPPLGELPKADESSLSISILTYAVAAQLSKRLGYILGGKPGEEAVANVAKVLSEKDLNFTGRAYTNKSFEQTEPADEQNQDREGPRHLLQHSPQIPRSPSFITSADRQILEEALSRIESRLHAAQGALESAIARSGSEKAARHALQQELDKLRREIEAKDFLLAELKLHLAAQELHSGDLEENSIIRMPVSTSEGWEPESDPFYKELVKNEIETLGAKVAQLESKEEELIEDVWGQRAAKLEALAEMKALKEVLTSQLEASALDRQALQDEVQQLREQLRNQNRESLVEHDKLRTALEDANRTIVERETAEKNLRERIDDLSRQRTQTSQTNDDLTHGSNTVTVQMASHDTSRAYEALLNNLDRLSKRCERVLGRPYLHRDVSASYYTTTEAVLPPSIAALLPVADDEEIIVAPYGSRSPFRSRPDEVNDLDPLAGGSLAAESTPIFVSEAVMKEREDQAPESTCSSEGSGSDTETETGTDAGTEVDSVLELFNQMSEGEEEEYNARWDPLLRHERQQGNSRADYNGLFGFAFKPSRFGQADSTPDNWRKASTSREPEPQAHRTSKELDSRAQVLWHLLDTNRRENLDIGSPANATSAGATVNAAPTETGALPV